MEFSLEQIIRIMLDALEAQKVIEVIEKNPLQIRILTSEKAASELEESFLSSFDSDGYVLEGMLADFYKSVIVSLQEKTWDCDIEATKRYYQSQMFGESGTSQDLNISQPSSAGCQKNSADRYYWKSYHKVGSHQETGEVKLPGHLGRSIDEFLSYTGCHVGSRGFAAASLQTMNCVETCFKDASATSGSRHRGYGSKSGSSSRSCHSSCHSGCHSACHSAWGSGRSR